METETVEVERGGTDKMGKRSTDSTHNAEVVWSWGTGTNATGRFGTTPGKRQESSDITPQIFVPKGEDVQANDRIRRANGERYKVQGHALWDQLTPFAAHDFGYVLFQLESVNG